MNKRIRFSTSKALKSLIILAFTSVTSQAQVFNTTVTSEVTYPVAAVGTLAIPVPPATSFATPIAFAQVPGLYCNAHATAGTIPGDPGSPSAYIAETASWTVSNAAGWEDGYFTYGYTGASGVYVPVGTESIPGAKHLSAAYMTDATGFNGYIMVAYTVRHELYDMPAPCTYVPYSPRHYEYAQEYRIYNWPVITGTVTFSKIGRVSNIMAGINPIYNYPTCYPIYNNPYSLWSSDFAWDGNIVMDVNTDAKRVAFAWTGNGGATQLSVASINSGANPATPTLNISSPTPISLSASRDPLDIAFRRDPSLPSGADSYTDFIHTLVNDGTDRYYVIQNDYNNIAGTGGYSQLRDDASFVSTPPYGTMWTGTSLPSGRADQVKLDVPDVSSERRWAYAWSDGRNVYLRRFAATSSLTAGSAIGSSSTQIINNGSVQDMAGNPIDLCNTTGNFKVAIAHKGNNKNIFLAWLTGATISSGTGGSGFQNAISIELGELLPWPNPMRAISTQDYLHVQTNNLSSAREYVSLSHHSATTQNYLYNCFTADRSGNYLKHKNHDMTVGTTWRTTPQSAIAQAVSEIKVGPNPFTDVLQIQGQGSLQLQLSDIAGRNIASYNGVAGSINAQLSQTAAQLPSGAYILSVLDEKGQNQVFKLSKL